MSEAKPAPGPYLIAPESKDFVYALGPSGTNSFWAQVQSAGPDRIGDSEKAATARLFAAAPDLLEALQAFMALDRTFGTTCDRHLDEMAKDNKLAAAVKKARAAISRATSR